MITPNETGAPERASGTLQETDAAERASDARQTTSAFDTDVRDRDDGIGDSVRRAADATVRVVKEQASAMADEFSRELSNTADVQVVRGAEAIDGFARAIAAAGDELEGQSPQLARTVSEWADRVHALSQDLARRDFHQLMRSANSFARSQPTVFFGAAVAGGFALARFFKSSARRGESSTGDVGADANPIKRM